MENTTDETNYERDANGDIRFEMPNIDHSVQRWWRYTYIFHHFNEAQQKYLPYFNIDKYEEGSLEQARKDQEFSEVPLFHTPDQPPYDFFIRYHNALLGLRIKYFKEVFEEKAFIIGYMPSHIYYRLIMPKKIQDSIINCINNHQLLEIRDLVFEIIAVAQKKYVKDISFWERPDMQAIVDTASAESQKAIHLVEKLENSKSLRVDSKPPAELLKINFVFQDETIKIEHPWLAEEFIKHFKEHYDGLAYKNWKLDLERYPEHFEENIQKQQFKYKLALSLYNLFTKEKFFKLKNNKPYPNNLISCIIEILEFCLVPVGKPGDIASDKIRLVRNWLTRKDFRKDITYLQLPLNKERLAKYFGNEFVQLTGEVKRADAISIAYYLGKRFSIQPLIPDLAHIAQVLKETAFLYSEIDGDPNLPTFDEYLAFKKFIEISSGKNIAGLDFRLDGDDQTYSLNQRLPLFIIEQSFREFSSENKFELKHDIIKTTVTGNPVDGYRTAKDTKLNNPEDRFIVNFIGEFYDYLLHEAPPKENDFLPSSNYYTIIAQMLIETLVFSQRFFSDDHIVEKVRQWHALYRNKIVSK